MIELLVEAFNDKVDHSESTHLLTLCRKALAELPNTKLVIVKNTHTLFDIVNKYLEEPPE